MVGGGDNPEAATEEAPLPWDSVGHVEPKKLLKTTTTNPLGDLTVRLENMAFSKAQPPAKRRVNGALNDALQAEALAEATMEAQRRI